MDGTGFTGLKTGDRRISPGTRLVLGVGGGLGWGGGWRGCINLWWGCGSQRRIFGCVGTPGCGPVQ